MKRYIEMWSSGVGSWAAAKRRVAAVGVEPITLLFADTLIEDEDNYRFLIEGAASILGASLPRQFIPPIDSFPPIWEPEARALFLRGLAAETMELLPGFVWLIEGRTPWQVFFDERFLGNSRVDPCSKILKRQMADRWLAENCDPAVTIVDVGIDWSEAHRFDDGNGGGLRPRRAAAGWVYEAPLTEPPYHTKQDVFRLVAAEGLRRPRLYDEGHSHANCGGWCVKAGHAQAANLLRRRPEIYRYHEGQELTIRAHLGADVSMMTDRRGGGDKRPLTMKALRERIEAGGQIDIFDWGGCGCFSGVAA